MPFTVSGTIDAPTRSMYNCWKKFLTLFTKLRTNSTDESRPLKSISIEISFSEFTLATRLSMLVSMLPALIDGTGMLILANAAWSLSAACLNMSSSAPKSTLILKSGSSRSCSALNGSKIRLTSRLTCTTKRMKRTCSKFNISSASFSIVPTRINAFANLSDDPVAESRAPNALVSPVLNTTRADPTVGSISANSLFRAADWLISALKTISDVIRPSAAIALSIPTPTSSSAAMAEAIRGVCSRTELSSSPRS